MSKASTSMLTTVKVILHYIALPLISAALAIVLWYLMKSGTFSIGPLEKYFHISTVQSHDSAKLSTEDGLQAAAVLGGVVGLILNMIISGPLKTKRKEEDLAMLTPPTLSTFIKILVYFASLPLWVYVISKLCLEMARMDILPYIRRDVDLYEIQTRGTAILAGIGAFMTLVISEAFKFLLKINRQKTKPKPEPVQNSDEEPEIRTRLRL